MLNGCRRLVGVNLGVIFSSICVVVLLGIGLSMLLPNYSGNSKRVLNVYESLNQAFHLASELTFEETKDRESDNNGLKGRQSILPIPGVSNLDPRKAAIGNRLFHDPRLSSNNQISCGSCHKTELGGADGLPQAVGINGQVLAFNTPTVWNSSLNFRQFWDGRAATLEEQINDPILDPQEMNASWPEIVLKLSQTDDYMNAFRELYPEGLRPESIRDAIATYERTLLTPNSRFDQYLQGDQSAITAAEKEGYQRFTDYGCASCHQGVNVGGNLFQELGIMEDFFAARGHIQPADLGRMNVTGRLRDRYVFKVPSLRNVELTAPYLHDGSVPSLEETIHIMGRYQLGRDIPPNDVALIVQFLHTLTGEAPKEAL